MTYAVRDSATMLRRDLRHALRYPLMSLSGVFMPVLFLLLFAGVFGHTLGAGLGAAVRQGGGYIDYLIAGIIVMTACSTAETTAVNVSTDMTEGVIARFRTMAITRTSVLTGQVVGGLIIQTFRGLLTGTPIGNNAALAVAWCVGISSLGYLWARGLYDRNRSQ